jgi:hypothetical protein
MILWYAPDGAYQRRIACYATRKGGFFVAGQKSFAFKILLRHPAVTMRL